jgi:hypothetical protein
METTSRHVSVFINRPADDVYAYASKPQNISHWAAGMAKSPLQSVDGEWVADSPMGRITVAFCEKNAFGVLDHIVTLPSGDSVLNPMRVVPSDPHSCEVIFTLRKGAMTEDEFEHDASLIAADLQTLRGILEDASAG